MSHLSDTHIGWENEHLATFLLSRLAFVAQPVTVGDDLGVDFYCTLFTRETPKKKEQLFPKQAFSVQVKTNPEPIPADTHIEYLKNLELPFFVGVIHQDDGRLCLYSGDVLPFFFSAAPPSFGLILRLQDSDLDFTHDLWGYKDGTFTIPLPRICDLRVADRPDEIANLSDFLMERCRWMQKNIISRRANEYIFEFVRKDILHYRIVAGPGSEATFRLNLFLRLGEAFYNLKVIKDRKDGSYRKSEFELYERCYRELVDHGHKPPDAVRQTYDNLRAEMGAM